MRKSFKDIYAEENKESTMKIFIIAAALTLTVVAIFVYTQEEPPMEEKNMTHKIEMPPIDLDTPAETKTATFALGCFWGAESTFGCVPGVIRTRVGYAGGTTENPTYRNIDDHIETVQIEYDPTMVSYEELLEIFWNAHTPTSQPWKRQYMSVIFTHTNEQRELASSTRNREAKIQREIATEIIAFSKFYPAEDYHQKYHLQQYTKLMNEFTTVYPNSKDFINSTAVTRTNGYVGGCGTLADLQEEIDQLGLSKEGKKYLLEIVSGRKYR